MNTTQYQPFLIDAYNNNNNFNNNIINYQNNQQNVPPVIGQPILSNLPAINNHHAQFIGLPNITNQNNLEIKMNQYFNLKEKSNPKPKLIEIANSMRLLLPFLFSKLRLQIELVCTIQNSLK